MFEICQICTDKIKKITGREVCVDAKQARQGAQEQN